MNGYNIAVTFSILYNISLKSSNITLHNRPVSVIQTSDQKVNYSSFCEMVGVFTVKVLLFFCPLNIFIHTFYERCKERID